MNVLRRLVSADRMYAADGGHPYQHLDHLAAGLAWRLEYRSRRYHEIYALRRGKHGHKGAWDDCQTVACQQDRNLLASLSRPYARVVS